MSKTEKDNRRTIFFLAWQFVKMNGFTMSEALITAWRNFKLKNAMKNGIARFVFRKVNGELREAYGTLKENLLPPTQGSGRRPNPTVQTYYDTERCEYRCYKKANLLAI